LVTVCEDDSVQGRKGEMLKDRLRRPRSGKTDLPSLPSSPKPPEAAAAASCWLARQLAARAGVRRARAARPPRPATLRCVGGDGSPSPSAPAAAEAAAGGCSSGARWPRRAIASLRVACGGQTRGRQILRVSAALDAVRSVMRVLGLNLRDQQLRQLKGFQC
jgi:hypothetical protein